MKNKKNRSRRVTTDNANLLPRFDINSLLSPKAPLSLYEDRRQWNPEDIYAPARSFTKTRHRLTVVNENLTRNRTKPQTVGDIRRRSDGTLARIAFQNPDKVLICARRQIRREVMHAFGKAGRGGQKSPKFNEYSKISCRKK